MWVSDTEANGEPGRRARFAATLAAELKDWREPQPKPVFCKHCPFAEHVHYQDDDGKLLAPGCSGFEPR
jgi:hypothetical protein